MIGLGLVGYGYWGPNLLRNFAKQKGCTVRYVCDQSEARRAAAEAAQPGVKTTADFADLLNDPEVQAIAIATPTSSHFPLALKALQAGKHVLVEKPMTASVEEGEKLLAEAKARGLTLMVDHTFIYTPAVRRMRDLVRSGELGDVLYYDSTRINLGLFQHDVDVLWDLAVHDLSILAYLVDDKPLAVSATGKAHVAGSPENVAFLTVSFGGPTIAHVNVNWLAPVKIRRTILGGSKKMVVYDDLEPSEKIKIYDKGVTIAENAEQAERMRVGYRIGDMHAPNLDAFEALSVEAAHFLDCIANGTTPDTPGDMGLQVVRILEAATQSMREGGRSVAIA
ncbi:MAG: Gfo/Idh/MocA family protein [Sphingomonas sp.]|uniref:Gfo/Idh/MocA family protein n=1 Tax=Sphingomonas sp. TaxID=28214 RepID=UPI003F805C66